MPDVETLRRGFQLGRWQVLPDRGLLRADGEENRVEPKVMDVLLALAARQGEVVSKDDLCDAAWDGRPITDDVITHAIRGVRAGLGDNARSPEFVENIPRRGYRLIMPVTGVAEVEEAGDSPVHAPRPAYYLPLLAGFFAVIAIYVVTVFWPSRDDIQSLAIFPFECAESEQILCYSFTEELISKLLQASDIDQQFKVVRSREPFPQDPASKTIADRSNVDGILLGKLLRSGDQIHVSVEVLSRRDRALHLTKSYEGQISEAVGIRTRLAADVAQGLFKGKARALVTAREPVSFEALEAFTRGQYELSSRSLASLQRAIKSFEKTIELDSNFGPAYVNLGYAQMLLPEYDPTAPKNRLYGLAIENARRAVAVDPASAGPAQSIHGFIEHQRGQWAISGRAHEAAINAPIVYPISHHLYSQMLATVGRLEDSLAEAHTGREIDPQEPPLISRLAIAYFWLDDLENAAIYFDLSKSHPEFQAPIHDLAYALFLIRTGDFESAIREARAGIDKFGFDSSWIPLVFAGIEDPEKRAESHEVLAALSEKGVLFPTIEISLWVLLQDGDRAMQVARRLPSEGEVFPPEAMFIPQFAVLRSHPDFPALLQSLGLTEYWDSIGCAWRDDKVRCGG